MADLCTLSATQLADLLEKKQCSSEEAVRAHLDRIDRHDARLRAFATVFRDEAIAEARERDKERARGERKGPLHGMPVSVKESIDIEGLASTMGVPSRKKLIANRDGGMIQMLREAGAVILGRTNVSQYLLFHESRNPIFGQCANPWSLSHGPGGSSGGEASALAAGLSPLGIGTDIGGSIRVPAHFCGVAGLKPTLDRWTNRGSNTALAGQEAIRGQIGPMARTSADVTFLMNALDPMRMSAIDARVPPVPFVELRDLDKAKLRVGVYLDDGLVPVSTSVRRAVQEAADALARRGAQIEPFTPPSPAEQIYGYFAALSADDGAILRRGLAGGEIDPVIQALLNLVVVPKALRHVGGKLAARFGEEKLGRLLGGMGAKPVDEFWRLTNQFRSYRFAVTDALDAAKIDVVLSPAHATPALPHGLSRDFLVAGSHSMLWNLVQFPGGVVPVSRVRPDETHRSDARDRLEKRAAAVDEQSSGLPLGVQVVARPWREDLVLAVMQAIEEEVRSSALFPMTPHEP